MKVIVCLDDNGGMLFNKRRQSRDVKVLENVWKMTEKLWIHSFSEKLFSGYSEKVVVNDALLENAGEGVYCWIENLNLGTYQEKIEQMIVYKWNRKYPSDFKLDLDLTMWNLVSQEEFEGSSHEKIKKEIYEK